MTIRYAVANHIDPRANITIEEKLKCFHHMKEQNIEVNPKSVTKETDCRNCRAIHAAEFFHKRVNNKYLGTFNLNTNKFIT